MLDCCVKYFLCLLLSELVKLCGKSLVCESKDLCGEKTGIL